MYALAVSALLSIVVAAQPASTSGRPLARAAVIARAVGAYGRLPLSFEANRGQTDARVKFLARGAGYTLFLTPQESVLSLRGRASHTNAADTVRGGGGRFAAAPASFATVRMRLLGGNARARLVGIAPLPGKSNDLIGRNSKAWRTGVPSYASALSRGVYPGVDLLYHGNQGHLEYDFRVAPGADPGRIALAFSGARKLSLDQAGNLVLDTAAGVLRQDRPLVYQHLGGRQQFVSGRFVLRGHRVGFRLGAYDRSMPLVIDPALVYSTYLGKGTGGNYGNVVAVDSSGAAYVAGSTAEVNFPTTSGAFQRTRGGNPTNAYSTDAFVTKLNPAGDALVYSTYVGGVANDGAWAIAVDSSGRAYIAGQTGSSDFPTATGAFDRTLPSGCNPNQCSVFLSVLKADGSGLDYSTLLGGSGTNGVGGVAIDSSGDAYLTGGTSASNFPVKAPSGTSLFQPAHAGGYFDAFVAKLDPAMSGSSSLVYSTYLGGTGNDFGAAIAVDAAGDAYVAGNTSSTDFPTTVNAFQSAAGGNGDGFVTELNPAGSALVYSTYLGGSASDGITALALDAAGRIYVTGNTTSTDFPTKNAFQPTHAGDPSVDFLHDAFVTKLDPSASGAGSLVYSSYLGGLGDDYGTAIAVKASGSAYVAGNADAYAGGSTLGTFPTVDPVAPSATSGDAFVSAVKPDGSGLSFSTYLGGGDEDQVGGLALDSSGNVYMAGNAASMDFPTTQGAYQPQSFSGGNPDSRETFVAKLAPVAAAAPLVTGLGRRSGPAGTSLVITGHGFSGATAVRFGSVVASTFTVDSDGQITATVPIGASGAVFVAVTTSQGTSPPNPIAAFVYAQGTWDLTGSMNVARQSGGTATLLADGRVLLAGGTGALSNTLTAAELYDPTTGKWTATGSMGTARQQFTATLLRDGKVLVAGGLDQKYGRLASTELYDPASGTWSSTGSLATARSGQTATLLSNGKVLVAGGVDQNYQPLASAELYDPATGAWTLAGSLADARSGHTATLLSNGKVLVVGGNGSGGPLASAELYDPATNSWATTDPLNTARADHTATLLPDGNVLVAGGDVGFTASLNSAEIYNPSAGAFLPTGAMTGLRSGHAAALLPDGRVLVVGGTNGGSRQNTAELYDPASGQWASAGVMNRYRGYPGAGQAVFAVPLAGGKVLVAGDSLDAGATTELYSPAGPPSPPPGGGGGAPVNVALPSISGAAVEDQVLAEAHGSWTNSPTSFAYQWQRCDSAGNACAAISGAKAQTYTLTSSDAAHTIRVQESAANTAGTGGPASSNQTAVVRAVGPPVVTGYRMTNRTFVVADGGTPTMGSSAAVKKHKKGTIFTYTLSEKATVKIAISKLTSGRRSKQGCLAPTKKLRNVHRCVRLLGRGRLTRMSHRGANKVAFSGRIGSRALKPGTYRATLTATDAAKRSSKPQTILFTIVRR
jgi:hypothetical protein